MGTSSSRAIDRNTKAPNLRGSSSRCTKAGTRSSRVNACNNVFLFIVIRV
jgi:hypothetical protein